LQAEFYNDENYKKATITPYNSCYNYDDPFDYAIRLNW